MWRWPVVQARKDSVNKIKGKIFSIHAKLIAIASSSGWNPDDNPNLALAIQKAKKDGVPTSNIEKAIKKWTWEDKNSKQITEIIYEWYAPGWISVMILVLTDNKNRTVSNIRHIFSKFGGNMWENGSVSWSFHRRWVIFIDPKKYDTQEIENLIYETDSLDFIINKDYLKIITSIETHSKIEDFFEERNIELIESKLDFVAEGYVEINEFEKALKFTKMIEAFNEDEDVAGVSTNEIISEELQKEVNEFIEKNSFKT